MASNAGAQAPAYLRAVPIDPVAAAEQPNARQTQTDGYANRTDDAKAPPSARTRLAAQVRPVQNGDAAYLDQRRSAAFVAQVLAQELMPEEAAETPLGQRAGYAAYAAADGGRMAVLGPAYAGIGVVV
ncbi:MAG: hypothetical protein RIM84_13320 [Alphaproteobacteria bacterium]